MKRLIVGLAVVAMAVQGQTLQAAVINADNHLLNAGTPHTNAVLCARLHTKASGGMPYGAQQYRFDIAEYHSAAEKYYALGDGMNAAFRVLRPFLG